jgi:ubiquinone/menaquinone biosynthesis C-methylase UbiE
MTPYDRWGFAYHAKRTNPRTSFWNDQLDYPAVSELLRGLLKGRKVLDLGCGSGIFTKKIQRSGGKVVGLDRSKVLLEIAREENPTIPFIQGSALKLPFPQGRFEIVSSNLLIHYFRNLSNVFKEVARVLKPGGRFVFSFHHPVNEVVTRKEVSGKTHAILTSYFHERPYRWKMLQMKMVSYHHTFENVFEALYRTGFRVERLLEPTPPPSSRRLDPTAYRWTTRIPSFCAVRARKA